VPSHNLGGMELGQHHVVMGRTPALPPYAFQDSRSTPSATLTYISETLASTTPSFYKVVPAVRGFAEGPTRSATTTNSVNTRVNKGSAYRVTVVPPSTIVPPEHLFIARFTVDSIAFVVATERSANPIRPFDNSGHSSQCLSGLSCFNNECLAYDSAAEGDSCSDPTQYNADLHYYQGTCLTYYPVDDGTYCDGIANQCSSTSTCVDEICTPNAPSPSDQPHNRRNNQHAWMRNRCRKAGNIACPISNRGLQEALEVSLEVVPLLITVYQSIDRY
jgi:hypothetical protein